MCAIYENKFKFILNGLCFSDYTLEITAKIMPPSRLLAKKLVVCILYQCIILTTTVIRTNFKYQFFTLQVTPYIQMHFGCCAGNNKIICIDLS